jgi:hypothetical protein
MSIRLSKQQIEELLLQLNTKEKAREFLREAGIIDEYGNLTKPYQAER